MSSLELLEILPPFDLVVVRLRQQPLDSKQPDILALEGAGEPLLVERLRAHDRSVSKAQRGRIVW